LYRNAAEKDEEIRFTARTEN